MLSNTDYHETLMAAVDKKFYDSEGQEIIGASLDSIAHSLASIADALDEINGKLHK